MKFKHFIIIFLSFYILKNNTYSQPERGMMFFEKEQFNSLFYEAFSLPANDKSKSRLLISTRLIYDFITFTRIPDVYPLKLSGNVELTVEIFDSKDNSIAREIYQKEINISEDEQKELKNKSLELCFEFELKPDIYNIFIELSDKEANKSIKKEIKNFNLKDFNKNIISDLIFISATEYNKNIIKLINRSGNIPFGHNALILSENLNKYSGLGSITLQIFKFDEKEKILILTQDIKNESLYTNKKILKDEKYDIQYHLKPDSTTDILVLFLQTDTFEIGKYQMVLTLKSDNYSEPVQKNFEIFWYDMPFSLRDFQIAQSKLKNITSEEEYKHLTSGSTAEQRQKFLDYWKKKDPTPKTSFNEVMNEFYKRVDHAMMNFSTLREIDGSNTDRGKTFILYGKPDKSDRELLPNVPPREIWVYYSLQKRFIFIDELRQGDYKLTAVEKL
jgi:GWxTD domain-containing protein